MKLHRFDRDKTYVVFYDCSETYIAYKFLSNRWRYSLVYGHYDASVMKWEISKQFTDEDNYKEGNGFESVSRVDLCNLDKLLLARKLAR
jgi:hypothetical protein